jgi:hypothetical protein
MSLEFRELRRAYRIHQDAQGDLYKAIEDAFKPGLWVHYFSGSNLVPVCVVETSMDRIRVNSMGGKSYWISFYRFAEFKEAAAPGGPTT